MKKNKATYERPTTNLLVVRFEQGLLQVSLNSTNSKNKTEYFIYDDDNYSEL